MSAGALSAPPVVPAPPLYSRKEHTHQENTEELHTEPYSVNQWPTNLHPPADGFLSHYLLCNPSITTLPPSARIPSTTFFQQFGDSKYKLEALGCTPAQLDQNQRCKNTTLWALRCRNLYPFYFGDRLQVSKKNVLYLSPEHVLTATLEPSTPQTSPW